MSLPVLIQKARLISGLVLMAFVTMHLANLAIGLHSLDAMEAWREHLMGPWQTLTGQFLLNASAVVHAALGLWSVAARRSLVMTYNDMAQFGLGLLTPVLLINHVLTMRLTYEINADFAPSYGLILAVFWSFAPLYAFQQLFVVIVVWIHAALGLHSWLVLKPFWPRIGGFVLPVLFGVPVLALLGFVESGKEVIARLGTDSEWLHSIQANAERIEAVKSQISALQGRLLLAYASLAALALAVLAWRILSQRSKRITVAYEGGTLAKGRLGLSLLEFSQFNHMPHAHVCSGRGRCGTCRVKVLAGAEFLSTISTLEQRTLTRTGSASDVRLACQALVQGSGVQVERLLPGFADATAARAPQEWMSAATTVPADTGSPA